MNKNKSNINLAEVARITKLAIGSRSCVDFANESGLSISFISRLINCNLPSIPSRKSLLKIAVASEERVTCEQLLIAAGYEVDDNCIEICKKGSNIVNKINNHIFIISDDVDEVCTQIYNLIGTSTNIITVIVLAKKLKTLTMLQQKFQTQNNIFIQYALILD